MKTLVIHPLDASTQFLSVIYKDKDWTVISHNVSKSLLKKMIKDHDRIVMLGHGDDRGLYGFGRFVIDSTYVYLLRDKSCVCIWCNADKFVDKYKLKGFFTGMIISDIDEAYYFNVSDRGLDDSNKLFADAIKSGIDKDCFLDVVKSIYDGDTQVIDFNKSRIYSNV